MREVGEFEVDEIESLRGLEMILLLSIHSLILEGDSLFIIEVVNSREQNLTILGPLVIEIYICLEDFKHTTFFMLDDRVMRLPTCWSVMLD